MRIRTLIKWGICIFYSSSNLFGQCDSVAIQNELNYLVCPNESITYNGVEIPGDSTASFNFLTPEGCDSVVTVTVEAIEIDTNLVALSACSGDSVEYLGHTILAGESKLITVTFSDGCDTSFLISVDVLPNDTSFHTLEICEGDSLEYEGFVFSEGDHRLLELVNHQGCDSLVYVSVETKLPVAFQTTSLATCPEAAEGEISIQVTNGTPPFRYALGAEDFQDFPIYKYLKSGDYSLKVADSNGCEESKEAAVPERERLEIWVEDQLISCSDPHLTIRPLVVQQAGELQWEWADGSDKEWLHVDAPGRYSLIISDDCTIDEKLIDVSWGHDRPQELIYVPNAFSPNADGYNDSFQAYLNPSAEVIEFEIQVFDRWGSRMFFANNPKIGWDGQYQFAAKNPAVFAYFVRAEVELCGKLEQIFKKGDVTLLR
ncbi:MAG: gliding motility-associated C-terminal domain-containing protein [Bacteroidota bacterium]